jgi:hypothetical protein
MAQKLVTKFTLYGKDRFPFPKGLSSEEFWEKYPEGFKVVGVSWWCEKFFVDRPFNNNVLSADLLPDQTGVLLVQPPERYRGDNASIVNADGTERFRLKNPFPNNPYYRSGDEYSFLYPTSINDRFGMIVGVTAKSEIRSGWINVEWFYELDTDTGQFNGYHEVR